MPISADPDKTAEYVLPTDADKPADTRPTFICRFMTKREYVTHGDIIAKARSSPATPEGDAECYHLLQQAIAIGVVGWRNMVDRDGNPVPFSTDNFDAVLSDLEIWELAANFPLAIQTSEVDAKKSALRLRSTGESSATDAPPEGA
jgi:hypothetical protein